MFAFTIIKQQIRTVVPDEGGTVSSAGNIEITAFNDRTDWLFDADNEVQIQVIKGKIKLKIENKEVTVQEGGTYVVPRRREYRIFSDKGTEYRRTSPPNGPVAQSDDPFITVGLR